MFKRFQSSSTKPSFLRRISGELVELKNGSFQLYRDTGRILALWSQVREQGKVTNRRDTRLTLRVKHDWARIVPATVYCLLPMTFPTIPLIFRYFPGFIPSFMITSTFRKIQMKEFNTKQDSLSKQGIQDFIKFVEELKLDNSPLPNASNLRAKLLKMLNQKTPIKAAQWVEVLPLINLYCIINSVPSHIRKNFLKFTSNTLRFIRPNAKFFRWADWIIKDNAMLKMDGFDLLSEVEALEALQERGIAMPYGTALDVLRRELRERVEQEHQIVLMGNRRNQNKIGAREILGYGTVFVINHMHYSLIKNHIL